MGIQFSVKLKGLKQLGKKGAAYKKAVAEETRKAVMRGAFNTERAAKEMCPVDYGRLRASISVNWSGSSMSSGKVGSRAKRGDGVGRPSGRKGLTYVVGTRVEYSVYVEHGTRKMAAQPYLHPAYFMHEGEIINDVKRRIRRL